MEIVDWVKERLEKKELGPGERLNSENELSELFGLSRQTVRHGIGVLEEEGIVVRRQAVSYTHLDVYKRQAWISWRKSG